jgi:hypothetical protein
LKKTDLSILFTCRDAGAAYQTKEIIPAFKKRGVKVRLAASGAAFDILKDAGLRPEKFNEPGNDDRLIDRSLVLLASNLPSAVFCGLTTIGHGVDEGVLYWASPERLDIPSFQFLDSWGTFNTMRGCGPSAYFAMDRDFKRFARKPSPPIIVTGSPKHYAYSGKDIYSMRLKARKRLGLEEGEKLVVYFGQLPSVPGHWENFRMLADAFRACSGSKKGKYRFALRPHPAYKNDYRPYRRYLEKNKVPYIDAGRFKAVEELICCCDVAATCYSTSAIDHAYLSAYSAGPIGAVMYLLAGKEIKNYLKRNFGYARNPLLERGIGYCVEEREEAVPVLLSLLNEGAPVRKYFKMTKILSAKEPCLKIVDTVLERIGRRHAR